MSGDYSRNRFNPRNHYTGVKMQQGRVQLDADWNEWTDAIDRRTRAETVDTFGVFNTPGIDNVAVVSPQTPNAFLIEVSGGTFTIDQGRMYVDGLLAENFGDVNGPQVFDPVLAELLGQNPITYELQPYHPAPAALPDGGQHLVYLVAWQRELTHLQQPDLVEKALGVDTTTRIQTVWQVRVVENIGESVTCTSPDTDLATAWADTIAPSAARLSSRSVGVEPGEDPCELPASGGYRGLENQLYRIEIHDGGTIDTGTTDDTTINTATFKWSRENGSVATQVIEVISKTELKLASLGRDAVLRFNSGDWVEIIDDWRELSGKDGDPTKRMGEMRQITVNEDQQSISFSQELPPDLIPTGVGNNKLEKRHFRVIRWDQKGLVRDADNQVIADLNASTSPGVIPVPEVGVWVTLENGVQVQFSRSPLGGKFHCNDYWTVAARTSDTSVEILDEAPPLGIHRHYARLALVDFPSDETDCREHWPPDCSSGCCTITLNPGDNIQMGIDSLPLEGGCVCLKTGVHEIRSPLEIYSSHIQFHGESPGTIVRAVTALPYLLEIGSKDLLVSDIEVFGIRFEATQPAQASGVSLLYLNHCAELRLEQCELDVLTAEPATYIGILMHDVRDVSVAGNRLSNLFDGIWVSSYLDRLVIENNHLAGHCTNIGGLNSSFGHYGIRIDNDFVVPCRIEDNLIDHFWTGVWLGAGTTGSSVSHNRFFRLGQQDKESLPTTTEQLRAYLDQRFYAIDIKADHCRVEANLINLDTSYWGGIRSRAEHTLIAGNTLRATSKASAFSPVPGSIYCTALADVGNSADHSRVIDNRLLGPQTGIVISRAHGLVIEGNISNGMGAGWFGVRVVDSNTIRICGNRVEDVFFGIYLSGGLGNRICDNHINQCGMGISSFSENYLEVSNNDVLACLLTGIALEIVASAKLIENRLSNCGYTDIFSFGIAVFAEHIFVESEAMVRIEGNEVLNTGFDPMTKNVTNKGAISIAALCATCNVSHNRTDYRQNILDPKQEHRALLLVGPLALHYPVNDKITLELMFGSAVVTDNRFRGPGQSHLVDFFPLLINEYFDFRFEKVTFNNNICEHLNTEENKENASVRLWGRHLIAMGNHIKADSKIYSMSLGDRRRVALMGNITTGDFIKVASTTPTPITDFNIRT